MQKIAGIILANHSNHKQIILHEGNALDIIPALNENGI